MFYRRHERASDIQKTFQLFGTMNFPAGIMFDVAFFGLLKCWQICQKTESLDSFRWGRHFLFSFKILRNLGLGSILAELSFLQGPSETGVRFKGINEGDIRKSRICYVSWWRRAPVCLIMCHHLAPLPEVQKTIVLMLSLFSNGSLRFFYRRSVLITKGEGKNECTSIFSITTKHFLRIYIEFWLHILHFFSKLSDTWLSRDVQNKREFPSHSVVVPL